MYVYSLSYPACKSHIAIILLSVACVVLPYFSTLSHKRNDFLENVIEHEMCVLTFSTTFVWNISYSNTKSASYCHKCTNVFMWSTHYSCHILMKFEFSWQIFKKYSDVKFHENLSSGSRVIPCWRTDGHDTHDEINSRFFLQFCNFAILQTHLKWVEPYSSLSFAFMTCSRTTLSHIVAEEAPNTIIGF
jgi:hypothetical protein